MASFQENSFLSMKFASPLNINTKSGLTKGLQMKNSGSSSSSTSSHPSAPISMSLPKVQLNIPVGIKKKRNVMFVIFFSSIKNFHFKKNSHFYLLLYLVFVVSCEDLMALFHLMKSKWIKMGLWG